MKQKKIPLSLQIFLALGLGIAVGMAFTGNPTFAVSYIKPFGTIFLNLLKFVVVPIVFFSILSGIISVALQTSCENFSNNLQKRNGA